MLFSHDKFFNNFVLDIENDIKYLRVYVFFLSYPRFYSYHRDRGARKNFSRVRGQLHR